MAVKLIALESRRSAAFGRTLAAAAVMALCGAGSLLAQADSAKAEGPAEEKAAMELGGVVTVDYGGGVKELDKTGLRIGIVELGALVNIVEELTATVVISAEDNLSALSIDQAFASFTPRNGSLNLLFGQHYFNHGLLATRLISDPLITGDVEFGHPGLTATYAINKVTPGLGFTVIYTAEDSAKSIEESFEPTGALNLDYSLDEEGESVIRLSGLVARSSADVDLGASVLAGKFALDAEFYTSFADWKSAEAAGYFAGVAFAPIDRISIAVRHDGFSSGFFDALTMRFGGGIKVGIKYGIYCAAEFAHVMPDQGENYQELALQIGLEQKVKLPGFQRRTLTSKE